MKKPSAGQLASALLSCRQDLERQGQQVHNLLARVQALATENAALRRELGRDMPTPAPPPMPDVLALLSRRRQAGYDRRMGRELDAEQIDAILADIDILLARWVDEACDDRTGE